MLEHLHKFDEFIDDSEMTFKSEEQATRFKKLIEVELDDEGLI